MRKIVIVFGLILLAISCNKQDIENTYNNQEEAIDTYINNLSGIYRVVRNSGANRVVTKESTQNDTLAVGDSLYFYYNGYIFSNGKGELFATNHGEIIRENNIATDSSAIAIIYGKDPLLKGLERGLLGVKNGEQCDIIFSAKYGYGNKFMFNVPKLTPLFFEIEIEKIVKN